MKKVFNSILYQGFVILVSLTLKASTQLCTCVPIKKCTYIKDHLHDNTYKEYLTTQLCGNSTELMVRCDVLFVNASNEYESTFNPIGVKILTDVCDNNYSEIPPSMVALHYNGTKKESNCAGSLIADNYVLTTANCVKEFDEHKLIKIETYNKKYYGINQIVVHNFSDVALIKLDRSVNGREIHPICLPVKKKGSSRSKYIITRLIKNDKVFSTISTKPTKKKYCERELPVTGDYGATIFTDLNHSVVQYGILTSNSFKSLLRLDVLTWITNKIAA